MLHVVMGKILDLNLGLVDKGTLSDVNLSNQTMKDS